MILPILGFALGALSTGANVLAQNRQAAQQNAAIAAQIEGNKRQEELRQADVEFQKKILQQQFSMEQSARRQSFREQQQQFDLLNAQVESQRKVSQIQLAAQTEMLRRQNDSESLTVAKAGRDRGRERIAGRSNLSRELANSPVAQVSGLPDLGAQQAIMLAANVGLEGATSRNLAKPLQVFRQGLEEVRASREASAAIEQQLADYEQWMKGAGQADALQQGIDLATLGSERAFANSQESRLSQLQNDISANSQATLAGQRALSHTASRVNNRNAYADMLLKRGQLETGSAMAQAQSAMAQQQLYAQRSAGPNGLSALAQVAQQGLPLVPSMVRDPRFANRAATGFGGLSAAAGTGVLGQVGSIPQPPPPWLNPEPTGYDLPSPPPSIYDRSTPYPRRRTR